MEQRTSTMYILDRAASELSDGNTRQFYYSNRSYSYRKQGNNVREIKSMGSNKTERACPSLLKVTISKFDGKVSTSFWKTHCGHKLEIGRIRLDDETRTIIAEKLKEGVTFNRVLDAIREAEISPDTFNRSCLLERQDSYNIARDFNIDYATKRDSKDSISVKLWVTETKLLCLQYYTIFLVT
ncbi:unnamed protein product [Macrosiphum euphorbiae]|uniref:Uncharacterized protein n=1 Tax=Macrosiphum euphorbiae TaxID=13131 RepID=A0AAV0WKB6_9HEMI|nr:unnamed protein product [Macrosiphum euphorbiae]